MKGTEKVVAKILRENPQTRSNDSLLIAMTLEELGYPTDLTILARLTNKSVCETITRARRKVQQLNPFLANAETKRHRKEKEEEVKDWIRN